MERILRFHFLHTPRVHRGQSLVGILHCENCSSLRWVMRSTINIAISKAMTESAFVSPLVLGQDLTGGCSERCKLSKTSSPAAVQPRRRSRRGCGSAFGGSRGMRMSAAAASSSTVTESATGSTMICTSLTSTNVAGQLAQMERAAADGADLAEVRLDFLDANELPMWKDILARKVLPVIVTNRAGWEGGNWRGDDTERLRILAEAEQLGAEYIDVELAACEQFKSVRTASSPTAKLILSHHDFDKGLSLDELLQLKGTMAARGADVQKFAVMATSALDVLPVFEFLKHVDGSVPTIAIAMGEYGQATRLACSKFRAYLTFASVGGEATASAPGQISTARLADFFRFSKTGPATKLYGIIGDPVGHSMSPAMHNAAMDSVGIDGQFVYLPVGANVAEFIRKSCAVGFAGFSVTIPHKQAALEAVDVIDPIARDIGAINTVVRDPKDGKLYGYNTDWVAAIDVIEGGLEERSIAAKHVACIGAGGAGRALTYGALSRGASKVVIVNRTPARAAQLAQEIGGGPYQGRVTGVSLEEFVSDGSSERYDVIINTTSVGMHPNEAATPVPREILLRDKPLVFDAIYNPLETRLLREAAEAGCKVVSGLEMFVGQGAEQFRLWHGVSPSLEVMRRVVLEALAKV